MAIVRLWNFRDRRKPLTLSSRYRILVLCKPLCISNIEIPCDELVNAVCRWYFPRSDIADIKLDAFLKASEPGLRHPLQLTGLEATKYVPTQVAECLRYVLICTQARYFGKMWLRRVRPTPIVQP